MRTQVCIIGGGPAGMLLSHILDRNGIDSVVLERQTRAYVLHRIRAGVLESGSVNLLREVGLGERMDRDGYPHNGSAVAWEGRDRFFIDTMKYTGKIMMTYGQTALTEDLYAARDAAGGKVIDEAADVQPHDLTSGKPYVTYQKNGATHRVDCDYIAGCDGFHGVSRTAIRLRCSRPMRRAIRSAGSASCRRRRPITRWSIAITSAVLRWRRCAIRCSAAIISSAISTTPTTIGRTPVLDGIQGARPKDMADKIVTGPSIEKSIAPLRSFVAEPMRYGSLFLAGDAAHIVPPTGAKGLNLAISDVYYLSRALIEFYKRQTQPSRQLFGNRAAARLGCRAHVMVHDHAAASFSGRAAVREATTLQPVLLSVRVRARRGLPRGAICRVAALELICLR